MTRNGKIARDVNRRLDNGEPGVRLFEWLNTLPDGKEILKSDFENRPIKEVNLTESKQGGFIEWQAHRESLDDLRDLKPRARNWPKSQPASLMTWKPSCSLAMPPPSVTPTAKLPTNSAPVSNASASPCATSSAITAANTPANAPKSSANPSSSNALSPKIENPLQQRINQNKSARKKKIAGSMNGSIPATFSRKDTRMRLLRKTIGSHPKQLTPASPEFKLI